MVGDDATGHFRTLIDVDRRDLVMLFYLPPISSLGGVVAMLKAYILNDHICAHSNNAAHAMEIPPNARILFCNGQVGARVDGTVPEGRLEQVQVIFERIRVILAAANMTLEDIVKLTVYLTDKSILPEYFRERARLMPNHNPPATLLIVQSFPRQGVDVEIEAAAAKAS